MPKAAWKDIASRTYKRTWDDNVGLVAAGVALYGFFALLSLLGALVLIYGFVADPGHVIDDFHALTTIFPRDVAALITQQLLSSVQSSEARKGFGIALALLVALYGGTNGAGALITSLNIAYEEKEKRPLWHFYLLAALMALVALIIALAAIAATAGVAYLQHFLPQSSTAIIVAGKVAGYAALLLVAAISAGTLYRFGPSREDAKWRWITPGSLFAAVMWLLLTSLFGFYVTSLTDYNATYGSLGAVVALLTWLYLSAYAFVFGAELNSEIEHQTAKDSTTGAAVPMGERGAWAADNVADDGHVQDRPEEVREGERLTEASSAIDDADQG
jgi:membrane protein